MFIRDLMNKSYQLLLGPDLPSLLVIDKSSEIEMARPLYVEKLNEEVNSIE